MKVHMYYLCPKRIYKSMSYGYLYISLYLARLKQQTHLSKYIAYLRDNVTGKRAAHASEPPTPKHYSKCDKLQIYISTMIAPHNAFL